MKQKKDNVVTYKFEKALSKVSAESGWSESLERLVLLRFITKKGQTDLNILSEFKEFLAQESKREIVNGPFYHGAIEESYPHTEVAVDDDDEVEDSDIDDEDFDDEVEDSDIDDSDIDDEVEDSDIEDDIDSDVFDDEDDDDSDIEDD